MQPRKPVSERIRPILEAMERSIDAARRERTRGSEPEPPRVPSPNPAITPPPARVPLSAPSVTGGIAPRRIADDTDKPRTPDGTPLKARPKRPQNFMQPPSATQYRSRAS